MFDTAIGHCGLAWDEAAVLGSALPAGSAERTGARLKARFPDAIDRQPPPWVRRVVDDITALLRREPVDLTSVPVEMSGVPAFHQQVYALTRAIPPGSTRSYGEIATDLGEPGAAQAVGQALGNNPFPIVVPCHRVLAAGGRIGGFSATGGARTKLRMLEIEGAREPALFEL